MSNCRRTRRPVPPPSPVVCPTLLGRGGNVPGESMAACEPIWRMKRRSLNRLVWAERGDDVHRAREARHSARITARAGCPSNGGCQSSLHCRRPSARNEKSECERGKMARLRCSHQGRSQLGEPSWSWGVNYFLDVAYPERAHHGDISDYKAVLTTLE